VDDYDAVNKAYVDAISNTPAGWTCTVRTASSAVSTGTLTATASCTGNEKVVSGGCKDTAVGSNVYESHPTGQGWYCVIWDSGSHTVTAYANCCT